MVCQVDRPLDVAHIDDWPTIRSRLAGEEMDFAWWEFHQPSNVLVLCANHHRLLDSGDSSVSKAELCAQRERLFTSTTGAMRLAGLYCRLASGEIGKRKTARRFAMDLNRLFPLLGWLERGYVAGGLDGLEEFQVRTLGGYVHVRAEDGSASLSLIRVKDVPEWRNGTFTTCV